MERSIVYKKSQEKEEESNYKIHLAHCKQDRDRCNFAAVEIALATFVRKIKGSVVSRLRLFVYII